jgi:hypothetical protein
MGFYWRERVIPLLLVVANVRFRPRPSLLMDLASPERAEICQLADAEPDGGGTEVGAEIGEDAGTDGRQDEVLGALWREERSWRVEIWKRRTIERAPYEEPRWRGLTANRS